MLEMCAFMYKASALESYCLQGQQFIHAMDTSLDKSLANDIKRSRFLSNFSNHYFKNSSCYVTRLNTCL
jgi:hypothetical protein